MIRINLLPTKGTQKKEGVIVQVIVGAVFILAALAACWFKNGALEKEVQAEKDRIKQLEAQIAQLQTTINQVNDFKAKKRDLNQKIDTIKKLNDQRLGPVKLMEEFTYVLPRKAYISTYREVGRQLSLEGVALDGPTVSDFIDTLRNSKFFYDVQLIQVQQIFDEGKKAAQFSIICRVHYTPAGSAG